MQIRLLLLGSLLFLLSASFAPAQETAVSARIVGDRWRHRKGVNPRQPTVSGSLEFYRCSREIASIRSTIQATPERVGVRASGRAAHTRAGSLCPSGSESGGALSYKG